MRLHTRLKFPDLPVKALLRTDLGRVSASLKKIRVDSGMGSTLNTPIRFEKLLLLLVSRVYCKFTSTLFNSMLSECPTGCSFNPKAPCHVSRP